MKKAFTTSLSLALLLLIGVGMGSCARQEPFTGYLFAYFEGGGDHLMQEQLRFAVSRDARHWEALNGNRPIMLADTVSNSGGIRE